MIRSSRWRLTRGAPRRSSRISRSAPIASCFIDESISWRLNFACSNSDVRRLTASARAGEPEQDAPQVLERRLARQPAQAVPGEHAFHPRVRGDHGAAGVRLGLEVVDRVGHLRGQVRGDGRGAVERHGAAALAPPVARVERGAGRRRSRRARSRRRSTRTAGCTSTAGLARACLVERVLGLLQRGVVVAEDVPVVALDVDDHDPDQQEEGRRQDVLETRASGSSCAGSRLRGPAS